MALFTVLHRVQSGQCISRSLNDELLICTKQRFAWSFGIWGNTKNEYVSAIDEYFPPYVGVSSLAIIFAYSSQLLPPGLGTQHTDVRFPQGTERQDAVPHRCMNGT